MAEKVMMNKYDTGWTRSQRLEAKREDMTQLMSCHRRIQRCFQNVLEPLSHFSQTDINNRKTRDRNKNSLTQKNNYSPASLSEFCQQLRSRITQQSPHCACTEDQEALLTVMTSEVSLVWQDLQRLPADPTITPEENEWLYSCTVTQVLYICEKLYLRYLHLLENVQKQGIFSQHANRCRLAAQMANDLSQHLNIHFIRLRVAEKLKTAWSARKHALNLCDRQQSALKAVAYPHILDSCLHFISGYKKGMASGQHKQTVEKDLIEIEEKIGDLDLDLVYDLCCELKPKNSKTDTQCMTTSVLVKVEEENDQHFQKHITRMKGCTSMPDLRSKTLQKEFKMSLLPARPQTPLVLLSTEPKISQEMHMSPAEDLRRLVQDTDSVTDFETALPPLIQALNTTGSSKLKRLTYMLQKLEEEEQIKKQQIKAARPKHPVVTGVNVSVFSQSIARTAETRVTDRSLAETINISQYPPVYNDLTGEINPMSVRGLDRNLFAGAEIKEVYKELSKSISAEYFHFDEDPMIEPALNNTELMPRLKKNLEKKLMNPSLRMLDPYSMPHRRSKKILDKHRRPSDVKSQAYAAWHQWWKLNLSSDDYLDYISNQESDYLSVVFHLYDSDSSDEEDERKNMLQLKKENERKQQEKIDALRRQKREYVPGLWNIDTVLMGGLWKEPGPCEVDGAAEEKEHVESVGKEQIETRLERIWTTLCLSDAERLDMAIKYSSSTHRDQLLEATAVWEQAARLIQQRELLVSQLEEFETMASDPNRFFRQGHFGSSMVRMKESRHREKLLSKIAALDGMLTKSIHHISTTYNDTVTFKGRPYGEKMRWDRIEMLYWLQQERRVQAMQTLLKKRGRLPIRLPPLNHRNRVYPGPSLEEPTP
ncbi:coiled-coil domain-containing protein 87 isoform X2 [Trichomycterus rosablanca]|uniref:coiled-coil domain-containing protein 87 isoform X2 n=1 Tax=Trichomycterus rosablanca TaxID=2290929 RepID=UPI002F35A283